MGINNYFFRLKNWFNEGKYFWFFLVLLSVSLPIFIKADCRLNNHTTSFIAGVVLQVLGISTIVKGVSKKLKLFKDKDLLTDFFDYLSRFPISRRTVTANITGSVKTSTKVTGRLTNVTQPEHNFGSVIEYFNTKYSELNEHVSTIEKELKFEIINVQNSFNDYREDANIEINELKDKFESNEIKGIGLELFGVACLIYGLLLSSIPQINGL